MKAVVLTLVVVTGSAAAQSVPGTGGDAGRELLVEPSFVNTDISVGLAARGGNPEDTVVLFDGFELPWLFHDNRVRSILPFGSIEQIDVMPSAFGVEYGRGSSVVALSSQRQQPHAFGELTVLDIGAHRGAGGIVASARFGWSRLLEEFRPTESGRYGDVVGRIDRALSRRWTATLSAISTFDSSRDFSRFVAAARYTSPAWNAVLASSLLLADRSSIDTRGEIVRTIDTAAGLTELEWRLGQQTNSTRDTIDSAVAWRTDVGAWSSVAANLSTAVRATAGVRIDNFNGDVATQPRAQLAATLSRNLVVGFGAGAYRRPPNQPTELAAPSLNPERATHVATTATYDDKKSLRVRGSAYYIDRRRLVVTDSGGVLRNTGFGTSKGVELAAELRSGAWRASVSGALTDSTRFDYLRAAEHAAPFEQPVRLDAITSWQSERWVLSARFQLYSGLPFTPFAGAVYNSDTDTYAPLYVPPLSARAPFHHQIDLRVDYRFTTKHLGFDAFIDLHNAYGNRDALEYRYSYDYRDRSAISALPIFPFAGLRVLL
jgi:hypothetical protein